MRIKKHISYFLYAVFALLYFIPSVGLPHKICIPVFILAAFSIGKAPWQVTAALFLSALGDLAASFKGGSGNDTALIFQILFFALGHISYIFYFCVTARRRKRESNRKDGLYSAAVPVICAGIFVFILTRIVPCVEMQHLKICVACYAAIIMTMLFSALMTRERILCLGALLFVISDFILAWNMFVGEVPGEDYLTMISYYSAQAIIAGRFL